MSKTAVTSAPRSQADIEEGTVFAPNFDAEGLIPVVTTSIPVALPKERVEIRETKPENIIISVDKSGKIFWYDARVPDVEALVTKLKTVSKMKPQPEVQIRGDMAARYDGVGKILYACQRAGITKVAFITEPPPLGG